MSDESIVQIARVLRASAVWQRMVCLSKFVENTWVIDRGLMLALRDRSHRGGAGRYCVMNEYQNEKPVIEIGAGARIYVLFGDGV